MTKDLTFEKAYQIQFEHLSRWEKILKPDAFKKLKENVTNANEFGYDSPYDVIRGITLTYFVLDLTAI